jgi:lysophospholipase L1-like esterase
MKKQIILLWMGIALSVCSCHIIAQPTLENNAYIPANDEGIRYIGRVSFKNSLSPAFSYPGVEIRAAFEGTRIGMKVKPNSGYFMVSIDKGEAFKVGFLEHDSIQCLATGLQDGLHEISVMLTYEGLFRRPEFRGFFLDKGKKLGLAPALPDRKIEFIGNSITCGYGNEAASEHDRYSDATENYYLTYAAITARTLNAQAMVTARSGAGIYRNYAGPVDGSRGCMPNMYPYTEYTNPNEPWDFSRYTPQLVCVNLGTNDVSTTPYDVKLLENAYRNFLSTLRGHYPNAKIVFLTGCMLNGKGLEDVQTTLNRIVDDAIKAGDKAVYRFDFTPQDGSLGYGADLHPSIAQHRKMADELIPFLQKLMGW